MERGSRWDRTDGHVCGAPERHGNPRVNAPHHRPLARRRMRRELTGLGGGGLDEAEHLVDLVLGAGADALAKLMVLGRQDAAIGVVELVAVGPGALAVPEIGGGRRELV